MKYSTQKIIKRLENGEDLKYLFFWSHKKSSHLTVNCFSQWYDCKFQVHDVVYHSAEQYMMAEKAKLFNDEETLLAILSTQNPGKAKALGRQVKNFNQEVWDKYKFEIVKRGNFHKFYQNKELLDFLLNTKNHVLVEASPVDDIWGIGMAKEHENAKAPYFWKGENLLGFNLMEVRDLLNEIGAEKLTNEMLLP